MARAVALVVCCVLGMVVGQAAAQWSFGADLSTKVTEAQFRCMRTSKPPVEYVVVRAYRSSGLPDPNAANTLKEAIKAGYTREQLGVYIFPQPLKDGKLRDGGAQVKEMIDHLHNNGAQNLFTSIWLDVEGGRSFWSSNLALNRQFFESMRAESRVIAAKHGYRTGVYSSKSQWGPIVGNDYTGGTEFPIWYAQYNAHRDFGDWVNFGGWTKPLIHQFKGTTKSCGVSIDVNVMRAAGSLAAQMGGASTGAPITPPVTPPVTPANPNAACAAVKGTCQSITTPCSGGHFKSGKCSGPNHIRCCVAGPAPANLQAGPASSPPTPIPPVVSTPPTTPAAATSLPWYPTAAQAAPPSTGGRVIVEAEDTGKLTWIKDRRFGKKFPRMRMGKLRVRRPRRSVEWEEEEDA